jgi:aldehyde:ferredoxin oxidoreductase
MAGSVKGYIGKQLRVDLTNRKFTVDQVDPKFLRKFIGGSGYGAKLLYDEVHAGVDPLGPQNKLVFSTSPLSLNRVPGGGSVIICFKSPATGGWGESRCGGDFGPDLKRSGFDFLVIEGRSHEPLYLAIDDGKPELRAAQHLVAKSVSEKSALMRRAFAHPKTSIATIGVGGENLVKFASVMVGHRAAGRGGAGAVMGSKNLLGIAVSGSQEVTVDDPDKLTSAISAALTVLKANGSTSSFRDFGTMGDMAGNDKSGDWPSKNWRSNSWGKGEELFEHFHGKNLVRNHGCYRGCPVACGRIVEVKSGIFKTPIHEGGEYETISAFTAFVMNDDVDVAVHCDYLCNEYGIDTISCGAMIAFAMECYENGVIDKIDTDGIELEWGNSEVLPEMVQLIAERKGIGDILADGVKLSSERLGGSSHEYAIQIKGLEGPAHDPRSGKALAVTYCTANRGMCHIHPVEGMAWDSGKIDWGMQEFGIPDPQKIDRWAEKGKGRVIKILQDGLAIPDVLSTCKFMMYCGLTLSHWSEILSALTGWDIDGAELLRIGERVNNLQRMINVREGFSRKDDRLPTRILQLPEFGKYKDEARCVINDIDGLLDEYYEARGWHRETGAPLEAKLKELELV